VNLADIFVKTINIKLKHLSMGSKLFHAIRRTDWRTGWS